MCRLMCFIPSQLSRKDVIDINLEMEGIKSGDGFGYAYVVDGKFISKKTSLSLSEILKKNSYKDFFGDCFKHNGWLMFHHRKASYECGKVSFKNSHPFQSEKGEYSFCHNGRFEQSELVRAILGDKIKYSSETDSEVALHLLEKIGIKKFTNLIKDAGVFLALDKLGQLHSFKTNFISDLRVAKINKNSKKVFLISELPFNCIYENDEANTGYMLLNKDGEIIKAPKKEESKCVTYGSNNQSNPYSKMPTVYNPPFKSVKSVKDMSLSEYHKYTDTQDWRDWE